MLIALADTVADPARARALVGAADAAARSVDDPAQRSLTQVAVVGAAARTGDPDRANALAGMIDLHQLHQLHPLYVAFAAVARAFADTAEALERAGDPTRAQAMADAAQDAAWLVTDPKSRSETLAAVAARMPPERARRLVTAALQEGAWQPCLDVLAHLEPAVITAIAYECLRIGETTGS